jgi:methionyl aminopeptidase
MSVTIKSGHEIELMREAGRLLAIMHEELQKEIKPGISTWDINHLADTIIRDFGCVPNFLNYNGFPATICTSMVFLQKNGFCRKATLSVWTVD